MRGFTVIHLGPVHTTPFLLVSVFVASKLPFTLLRFCTKTERKTSVFCAFTLFRLCEAHCWILERFQKTSVFGPGGKHGVVGDVGENLGDVGDVGENLGDIGDVGESLGDVGENLGDVVGNLGLKLE